MPEKMQDDTPADPATTTPCKREWAGVNEPTALMLEAYLCARGDLSDAQWKRLAEKLHTCTSSNYVMPLHGGQFPINSAAELVVELAIPEGVSEEEIIETIQRLSLDANNLHRSLGGNGLKIKQLHIDAEVGAEVSIG